MLDKKIKVGKVKCSVCAEEWANEIHALSEPIDVYRCVLSLTFDCTCA